MASALEILNQAQLSFWANKPTAGLSNASGSFSMPNNALTAVTWSVEFDDNWSGHSNATNPSRYTAQVAGLYRFSGSLSFTANATGYRLAAWYYNGSEYEGQSRVYIQAPSATIIQSCPLPSTKIRMAVGDYVEMWGYQNSGGALTLTDGSWMDVEFSHF